MALVVKDRVKETTTTTGTGTITLAGAVDGFQSFSAALSDGDTTYYAISETSTGEWEVGLGTFTATGTTLARTTILASSNSGSAVSLTSEADVFITQPAGKSVFFDGSGDLTLNQDPTSALHAATKEYVDTIAAAGLHYHDPVRVEQEGNLSATYDNGTAGVGATLTNNSTQAALSIDDVTLSLNDRVLIYEQTNAFENGVYTVTDTGSASTNWVLTRATDADSYAPSDPDSLGQGDAFFVLEGTAGAGELYVMNTEGSITFGTTGITFTQVAATAVFTAGDGLTLTGTTFSVGAGTGVTVNANDIAIGQAVGTSDSPTFAGMTTTADITFGTDDKASFGTTLDVYSDGTDSYVVESGTGNLYIDSADLSIRNAAGTATMASFDDTGSVTLNHNNSTKFTTQSYGIDVTGNVQADGLVLAGDATFGDNDKAIFGAGSDLQIYHDGSNSFIKDNGTGNLLIQGATDIVLEDTSGANYFRGVSGSYVRLYHNNSTKLETTSTGVDITGTLTSDALTVSGNVGIGTSSPSERLEVARTDSDNAIARFSTNNATADIFLESSEGQIRLRKPSGAEFAILNNSNTERMRIDSSGNVGIGTSSPSYTIESVSATSNNLLRLRSESTAPAGAVSEFRVDTGANYVDLVTGSGDALLFSPNFTEAMRIDSSGNLLVGKTSANATDNGVWINNNGTSWFTQTSDYALGINRKTSDGSIVNFAKDGTTVGSIGANSTRLTIGNGDTGLLIAGDLDNITPFNTSTNASRDAAVDLGNSGVRFKDLHLSGNAYISGGTAWHSGNDGSGSGLDADTVDGLQASSFLRSDADDTTSGNLTIDKNTPRIDFKADQSGSNVGGRIELNENGNLWLNAQGGKDLWLNWLAPTSAGSYADLNVGDGNGGSYILKVEGSSRTVTINSGALSFNDSNTKILEGSGNSVRVQTNSGYVDIGPTNGSYCHFNTDRSQFYFNTRTVHNGDIIPYTDSTRTLGSSSNRWSALYADTLYGDGSNLTNLPAATGISSSSAVVVESTGATVNESVTVRTNGGQLNVQCPNNTLRLEGASVNLNSDTSNTITSGENTSVGGKITLFPHRPQSGSEVGVDINFNLAQINGYQGILMLTGNTNNSVFFKVRSSYNSYQDWYVKEFDTVADMGPYTWGIVKESIRDPIGGSYVLISYKSHFSDFRYVPFRMASDINLKTDIKKIENPLGKLEKINGYNFTWISSDQKDAGVIAQEVEEIMPDIVTISPETDDAPSSKTVNYNGLIGLLVEAVKEQQKQIDDLKEKLGV